MTKSPKPNPYDGEACYLLGLSLYYQGEFSNAYDAFYKATWSNGRKAAEYLKEAAAMEPSHMMCRIYGRMVLEQVGSLAVSHKENSLGTEDTVRGLEQRDKTETGGIYGI